MRVLVVGCGLVGKELAGLLTANGHEVVGTTTTPGKVDALREVCTDVAVLRGADTELVRAAADGCDAAAVCAGPIAARAMTPEERQATYHDVLVATAESVVAAGIPGQVVALSSLSVYGNQANHLPTITEDAPLTTDPDASPQMFQLMERTYREALGDRLTVFRCSDIFGGEDPPIAVKVKMAHEVLKGSVPFEADTYFYRVEVRDVARAVEHALVNGVTGTFNLTHPDVPPRNAEVFDAISAQLGFPALEYRNELPGPGVPVSVDALLATGFTFEFTQPEAMPA